MSKSDIDTPEQKKMIKKEFKKDIFPQPDYSLAAL